jgi:DNA-binding beta-propeller fold protein YncE
MPGLVSQFDITGGTPTNGQNTLLPGFASGCSSLAMHPAGTHLYVSNQGSHSVITFDIAGGALTNGRALPIGSYGPIAIDPAGTRLFVVSGSQALVTILDISGGTPVRLGNVRLPDGVNSAYDIATDVAGRQLFVAYSTGISNFDITTMAGTLAHPRTTALQQRSP